MVPRYDALGSMKQDQQGTYVAATDYDKLVARHLDLKDFAVDRFRAFGRGEITAEAAITAVAGAAVLGGNP